MFCRSLSAKGQEVWGAEKLVKNNLRKGVLKRNRIVRRRVKLPRDGDQFAGFPKEMLNCMFLFLITEQYQLAAERTETTDKRKTKTSKTKRTITTTHIPGSRSSATDTFSPPVPTAADAGPGHIISRIGLSPGSHVSPSLSHQACPSHFSHPAWVTRSSSQNTAFRCRYFASLAFRGF